MSDRTWDDETLSAWLDGEPGPSGPLSGRPGPSGPPPRPADDLSPADRARLEELAGVSQAVAAPVEPMLLAEREPMLARALAAAGGDELARRRARRVADWRWLAPVAALVVAVLVAVPLLSRDEGDDRQMLAGGGPASTAAQAGADDLATGGVTADEGRAELSEDSAFSMSGLPPGVTDGGELGAVDDMPTLLDRVQGAPRARRSTATATGAPDADTAGGGSGGTGEGAGLPCGTEATAVTDEPLEAIYLARLQWQGTPAVALAFAVLDDEGQATDRTLVTVLAAEDCRLLASAEA